jgi:methylmalonyl-CoA mutase cobalamin-binding domain/chain
MRLPGWHRDTYVEEYHRAFFTNFAKGRPLEKCGINDVHIGGLVPVPALFAALHQPESPLETVVTAHVKLTHEDPDVIGLSILSGSHLALVPDILARLAADGVDAPVVVGGIIPEADQATLLASGVAAVYTPKDFELSRIMRDVADLAVAHRGG